MMALPENRKTPYLLSPGTGSSPRETPRYSQPCPAAFWVHSTFGLTGEGSTGKGRRAPLTSRVSSLITTVARAGLVKYRCTRMRRPSTSDPAAASGRFSASKIGLARRPAMRSPAAAVSVSMAEVIAERARDVQIRMAARGHHRAAGVIDLITAAVAEHHGAAILHYDADFEHIAAVTGQPHTWIAPRGSLA